jgi:hypothetical protein
MPFTIFFKEHIGGIEYFAWSPALSPVIQQQLFPPEFRSTPPPQ